MTVERSRTPAAESEVTEQQELDEISELLSIAADRISSGNYRDARSLAAEALQIDATHTEVLKCLVETNLNLQRLEEAFYHAETLVELHPGNPLGYLMKAKVELVLKHYRDCVNSALKCLSMNHSKPREATELIARAVQGILSLQEQFIISLQELDFYAQLAEIGIVLLSSKQHVMVVQVLNVALQLQTKQYGISLLIYLTQGHAYCANQQYDKALKAYESCLAMAVSADDVAHQTKSLVNIAALHVSLGETYKAIVIYERLLDMNSGLQSDGIECSDVWTEDFLHGLYMNTSLAYRTVGSYDKALYYAQLYLNKINKENFMGLCSVHRHIGLLYETVGKYSDALTHYKDYLDMAKCAADKLEIAQAYGHIGSLYGHIGLWPLSMVYHERHVCGVCSVLNSATSLEATEKSAEEQTAQASGRRDEADIRKLLLQSYEMYGDTLMRRYKYDEAADMYTSMMKCAERNVLSKCRALYKIGYSHYKQGNSQHALHYYDQALYVCEDDFTQLLSDLKFGIALSLQVSTSSGDLEKGKKYFQESIDSLKSQIEECILHHKFLPEELIEKMSSAYQGMQSVLGKLGCDSECLEYAEESRIYAVRLLNQGPPPDRLPNRLGASEITSIVSRQGAHVLYYSFLDNTLLIWILTPRDGLARFYVKKPHKMWGNVEEELGRLLTPWKTRLADLHTRQVYKCERRHIQRKTTTLPTAAINTQSRAEALKSASSWTKAEKSRLTADEKVMTPNEDVNEGESEMDSADAVIEKKLYRFLASPVDDILSKIPQGGHLIVIPDRSLCHVPFTRLRDIRGIPLCNKFTISYLPGMYALKLVIENQVTQLQGDDEVNFMRAQSSMGGYYKYLHASELQYSDEENLQISDDAVVDRLRVSNPRLDVRLRSRENRQNAHSAPCRLQKGRRSRLSVVNNCVSGRMVQLTHNNEVMSRADQGLYSNQTETPHYMIPRPLSPRHVVNSSAAEKSSDIPQPCYHKSVGQCGKAASITKILRLDNVTTLISKSSTGTDALSSTTAIPEFTQISNKGNFVVIGNPCLSDKMVLGEGNITIPEAFAYKTMMSELELVSRILGCDFVYDKQASKSHFLEMACKASVLHIVTQVNLSDGFLVMSCDNSRLTCDQPIEERYYLVTVDDIISLKMKAKLVVISGGWTVGNLNADQRKLQSLPNAFILAGADCVITVPHPHTSEVLNEFYTLFYSSFMLSCDVCTSLNQSVNKVSSAFDLPAFPVHLYGNNVTISIADTKTAMLDQNIDSIETAVTEDQVNPTLNLPPPEKVPTIEEQLDKMQTYISQICWLPAWSIQEICHHLLQLVQDAITIVDKSMLQVPNLVVLPASLIAFPPAIQLLKLLRFNFEPRGMTQKQLEPAVVFPSWDPDGLLDRVADCLNILLETQTHGELLAALHDVLPVDQLMIARFIDVLSLTVHSPNVQLNVTDEGIRGLWEQSKCRVVLNNIGYHQVGVILHFNSTRLNQSLLKLMLRMFIMISASKPEILLEKLDISLIGRRDIQSQNGDQGGRETEQLQTILPVLLPNDKLTRRVPWSSRIENPDEMRNKKSVANRCWASADRFTTERRKLIELQLSTACVQAQEVLTGHAASKPKSNRVKVQSGSSASRSRVPVGYVPPLTPQQFEQRRKYSEFLKKSRISDLTLREKHDQRQILRNFTDIVK